MYNFQYICFRVILLLYKCICFEKTINRYTILLVIYFLFSLLIYDHLLTEPALTVLTLVSTICLNLIIRPDFNFNLIKTVSHQNFGSYVDWGIDYLLNILQLLFSVRSGYLFNSKSTLRYLKL